MLTRWMCFWRSTVSMFFEGTFQNLSISDRVNMAPSLVKYNWMFPWDQTANGFQFLKSPTQFPEEP